MAEEVIPALAVKELSVDGVDVDASAIASNTSARHTSGSDTTIVVADTTDTTCFVALYESATGTLAPKTDAALIYNATTGQLGSTFMHVLTSSSGGTAHVVGDNLIVEDSANAGISLLTANTGICRLLFADEDSGTVGNIAYTHSTNTFSIAVGGVNQMTLAANAAWFVSDVSALTYTDRTKRSKLTVDELKTKIKSIDETKDISKDGGKTFEIDKSSYPSEWIKDTIEYTYDGLGNKTSEKPIKVRDLTTTVSDMVRLVKDLLERIDVLESK